ncbi:MAG: zinc-binding dehydrogenase [Eubacteriales bacterium]|nr:zinc-binding dehydrogenase [Eubacteriales bacterium]
MTDYRVTFTGQCRAELIAHAFDPTPGPGELVGENLFSLISTGSERGGYTQKFPDDSYPMETGSSSMARVLAVGEGVTGFRPGDLFYHSEHHTRYVRLNAGDAIAAPAGAPPEKVLFGRYAAVSMTSVYQMKAKPADTVAVTGQGMVGAMCAAVLQAFGFRVYAVDPSAMRQAVSREMGIQNVGASLEELNVQQQSCAALLECSGNENALRMALPYLRHGADVYQIGVPWHKASDWSAHELLYQIFYGFLSVHGGWEWSIPRKNDEFHSHSSFSHIASAMEMIAQGKIKIPDSMYELRDPRDCGSIYQEITAPRMSPTSIIFDWSRFREAEQ